MQEQTEFLVLRDTREKHKKGWFFDVNSYCLGTNSLCLPEGDYTIQGHEKEFIIERKGSISEFAQNLNQVRFKDELIRLESYKYSFLILEFGFEDIIKYPESLNVSKRVKDRIKLNGPYLASKLMQIMLKYKTKVIFAGEYGHDIAFILFKKIANGFNV